MNTQIRVAEVIGRTLADLGVDHVFGVVGSGNFWTTHAMVEAGVNFTASRHEMGATCMADAYTRATGKVSAVTVHQGCGYSNAVTGIGEAAKCHTPILILAGDTPNGQESSNFYIDQDQLAKSVGARAHRIHSAATAITDTIRAFHTAKAERTPVVLSMPIDIQEELVEESTLATALESIVSLGFPAPSVASSQAVLELAGALREAERPVIVGGRGAWHADVELRELGKLSGALLATSAAGRGLFVGDDFHLDVMGGFSTDGAAELIQNADLLVAFGASLNRWTTRSGTFLQNKKVIQIDDDPKAFGFHAPVNASILGDTALTARAVSAELQKGSRVGPGYRSDEVKSQVATTRYWSDQAFDDRSIVGQEDNDRIDPRLLSNILDDMLPEERVVVPDGGNFNAYPAMHFRVKDPQSYCVPLGFQSIGLALSSGIGAGVAFSDRLPIVGVGDGGFMMSLTELDTAVRIGMRMVVVVYDDAAYGAEVHHFKHETDKLEIVQFPDTDISAIARGFGAQGAVIRRKADLEIVRLWLDSGERVPLVLDAKIVDFPSWVLAHTFGDDE